MIQASNVYSTHVIVKEQSQVRRDVERCSDVHVRRTSLHSVGAEAMEASKGEEDGLRTAVRLFMQGNARRQHQDIGTERLHVTGNLPFGENGDILNCDKRRHTQRHGDKAGQHWSWPLSQFLPDH